MNKILPATVAIAVLGATLPVRAADFGARTQTNYYNAPSYPPQIFTWTGFYLGGHVGGAFASESDFSGLTTGNNGNGRFLGGVQAGYDWQFNPNWVVGVEGQYSWLSGSVGAVFPGGFA